MRLEAHFHLGEIYPSRMSKTDYPFITAETALDYMHTYGITHMCVYYTEYKEFVKLKELAARENKEILGFHWIPNYDISWMIDEPLCSGIKVHSLRGIREETQVSFGVDSEPTYGLDYASSDLRKVLLALPDNWVVFYHTQGSSSVTNLGRPAAMLGQIQRFPNLKFVICHTGTAARSMRPKGNDRSDPFYEIAVAHEILVNEALYMAECYDNCYCESSMQMTKGLYKTQAIAKSKKVMLGSDYPFSTKISQAIIEAQEKSLQKVDPTIDIEALHQRAWKWLTNDL